MKTKKIYYSYKILLYMLSMAIVSACNSTSDTPPQPYGAVPTAEQIEWQKMEYYMFIHFGPNTFTDVEWGNGKEDPKVFNPGNLDCRQWAATAKAAGMKAIIVTAKHHDGFCLWPSKYSTHTVRESLWKNGKGDVLKELSEACKEYGLKFGVYLSPWDQNHPAYGTPQYNQIFANTLNEVLSGYGPIFEQWFDGACGEGADGKKQVYDWDMFHKTVYKNQPQAIIFSDVGPGCRWMGNERGVAGKTNWSRLNVKGFGPGAAAPSSDTLNIGNIYGEKWIPAEVDVSIRPGWFYSPSTDDKVKSVDKLLDIYYTSVGRNSNLLLNVPPDRRGLIHANDSARLIEFRKAVEAIFKDDLIKSATVSASTTRGNSDKFAAANLLDDNYDSYWATNDNELTASLEIDLGSAKTINRLLIQEYIPLGQRIAAFNLEYLKDGQWLEAAQGTTIGYKRILRFPAINAQKLRINITNSLACPVLNKIGLYKDTEKLSSPVIKRNKQGVVTIGCESPDPTIYYTTDGTEPSASSKVYKGEFSLLNGGQIKAMASIENGKTKSETVSEIFYLAPAKWTVVSPIFDGIERSIDGDSGSQIQVKDNQALIIDAGESISAKGFFYVPSNDAKANNIYRYNLYVSEDEKNWTKIKSNAAFDNIKNNPVRQDIQFEQAVKMKYLKLEPIQTTGSEKGFTIAEVGIITK